MGRRLWLSVGKFSQVASLPQRLRRDFVLVRKFVADLRKFTANLAASRPCTRVMKLPLLTPIILIAASLLTAVANEREPKTVSILAIGNSFTRNATAHLPAIAEASPHTLTLGLAAIGGGPLNRHWKAVQAHEADPNDRAGRIYGNRSLKQLLKTREWDFVTIQQRSYVSTDAETYRPFAANLAAYIREHAPTAELLIHQTWSYRADDPRFKGKDSQDNMYRQLTDAYLTIAGEIGVKRLIPVGLAFRTARRHPEWRFVFPDADFDFKNAVPPKLPRQDHSLNVGWRWNGSKLRLDGHHANAAGQFLGAAVWFEFFFDDDVRENAYVPEQLDAKDARFLREIAHQVAKTELQRLP